MASARLDDPALAWLREQCAAAARSYA